jgi:SAM-dependent methyltransferase
MPHAVTRATPRSREEYWRARTRDFDTAHPRLCVIRDLIESLPSPPASLLDVGCGRGTLGRLLPTSIEYFGIDIALQHFGDQPNPDHFQVVDLERSPEAFGDTRFEAVVCSGVLEYIADTDNVLRFLRTKVAPPGHLILSFTNRQHYRDLAAWLTGRHRAYKDPHVNFTLIPELVRAVQAHGFGILTHRTLTLSHRSLPVLGRFRCFPLNVFARQYVFLCSSMDH